MSNEKKLDDKGFWSFDEYAPKASSRNFKKSNQEQKSSINAIEIDLKNDTPQKSNQAVFSDVALNNIKNSDDGKITRFIPSGSDMVFAKKHILFEYCPENPLIKNVKVFSDKPGEQIFPRDSLFMRERRAYLNRCEGEQAPVPYYSYSPRYSNMNKSQLRWYLWWRENFRKGVFLPTDDCYLTLYIYELVCSEDNEDIEQALNLMCQILNEYKTHSSLNIAMRTMMCSLICDFCLIHGLNSPIAMLDEDNRKLFISTNFPEFFIDFSDINRKFSAQTASLSLSLYNYKKSKIYTEEKADLFSSAIGGAVLSLFNNEKSYKAITSFTEGMYGCLTVEKALFPRLIGIVNKRAKIEISYYQLSNIQSVITDAVRYSENKLREHLGIKNKLHILAINPNVKEVIDTFFSEKYQPQPTIDRRKKAHRYDDSNEPHDYDKLYDLPKLEISPERALMIERESWVTTRILTEAFSENEDTQITFDTPPTISQEVNSPPLVTPTDDDSLYAQIEQKVGDIVKFIALCKTAPLYEQRQFALSRGSSLDEITDLINEASTEIFGDIVIENDGSAYRIIEDYNYLFEEIN